MTGALAGRHLQTLLNVNESICEIIANPVYDGGQVTGAILIILDVTEKERGEALRREFTSNVSHELKTPLTSIYGVSDMLGSGLVKPEDVTPLCRHHQGRISPPDLADRGHHQAFAPR